MKFLDSKEISVEQGDVKAVFKPVTPLNQAALLGYQVDMQHAVKANDTARLVKVKMECVFYTLKEMISRLEVEGEIHDPVMVANLADVSDMETIETLNIIFDLTIGLLVEGDTKKKSSTQRKSTKKE
jgi:hypothetical protein